MPAATAKPPKPTAAEIEERRLEHRRSVKRQLAERLLLTRKADVVRDRIVALDSKRENAAAMHVDVCEGFQNELSKLEGEISTLLVSREPIPAKLESRRVELMSAVMDQNAILENAVEAISREQSKLRNEMFEFQKGSGESTVLQNSLCQRPLARHEWLLEEYSLAQASKFLDARIAAASERLALCRQRNAEAGNYVQDARDGFAWHLAKAEFEYAAATAESAAVSRRGRELREAMLDE